MPTKPEIQKLNASSADILNAIRANATNAYQERIPEATRDNIREIGNAMMMYESTQNEFLSALVNRIGRVLITSRMFENPLRMFKKGMLEFGETVEEIFVNIARAHQFDPAVAEKEIFKREIPDVQAIFHRMNVQNFYKVTISNDQLRQAFLSWNGITDLISRIVDSLYSGANDDEFIIMKQLIVDYANQGKFYPINIPAVTADNAKAIVTQIKAISNKLEFMSSNYNYMGVATFTPKDRQILIVDTMFSAVIDVEVLAYAFNMEKAEFMGRVVMVDDFGELTGAVAALVDENWFMVFDNFVNFTEQYNGEGLYWNYWYHVWKTFSTSTFQNAILFTTDTPAVTSVTVNPPTASITKGGTQQFTATVAVTGSAPQSVTWSVDSEISTITPTGLLTVPVTETATSLTVSATSTYDPTKSGTSTVSFA